MKRTIRVCDQCGSSAEDPKDWLRIGVLESPNSLLIIRCSIFDGDCLLKDSPGQKWIDCCGEDCLIKGISSLLSSTLSSTKEVA